MASRMDVERLNVLTLMIAPWLNGHWWRLGESSLF